MKKLSLLLPILLIALSSCTHFSVLQVETKPVTDGTNTFQVSKKTYAHGTSFLSNTSNSNLVVSAVSANGKSVLFGLRSSYTEPNSQAITATADGLGTLMEKAVKGGVEGAKGAP